MLVSQPLVTRSEGCRVDLEISIKEQLATLSLRYEDKIVVWLECGGALSGAGPVCDSMYGVRFASYI
jgi:hypothetical protein